MYRTYSTGGLGIVCRFCPVCPWGLLIVTSLVVEFLGFTLELFCNVCNLLVIVKGLNPGVISKVG